MDVPFFILRLSIAQFYDVDKNYHKVTKNTDELVYDLQNSTRHTEM